MNELSGQSLGGYILEEELGRGSMGMVYCGKQIALGREVAIKILPQSLAQDPSYVARFIREARIMAELNHPHIVQIYDAGQQNGVLYFVMEYVQGPTIGSLLHLDGSMPQHLAAEYCAQIAEALDAAYRERNVIHRDIKPENLMLDRWGKIKVMDFGLARAPGLQQITLARTLVGSIYYASPEQILGKPLDNRSDIYALGVVLYEMVTGQRPFSGRALHDVTQMIIAGRVLPPGVLNPDIAPELERIILTAMTTQRDGRFAQASLMAEELRALQLRPAADSLSQTHSTHTGRSETTVPKRPQISMPRYPDSDALRTQPAHERATPLPPVISDSAEQKATLALSAYDTSPSLPVPGSARNRNTPRYQSEQEISTAELPISPFPIVLPAREALPPLWARRRWRRMHRR